MLVDCPTPTEVKCWQCGGWGHIGKNCPERDTDPNLMNPVYLRELAGQHGWQWRRTKKSVKGVQKDIKTMFLKNDRGTKIDLYYGTMTIKTIVPDHPKGGKPLYRPVATTQARRSSSRFSRTRAFIPASGIAKRQVRRGRAASATAANRVQSSGQASGRSGRAAKRRPSMTPTSIPESCAETATSVALQAILYM